MNTIDTLKSAVRTQDLKTLSRVVGVLRLKGCTYQEIYRYALAGNPDLDLGEWDDLMMGVDDLDSRQG